MQCRVCHASFQGQGLCPNCGYDAQKPGADDVQVILRAREEFKARTLAYAPDSRVTTFDKLKPWLGLALGIFLFLFWLRACSTGGFF